MTDDVVARLADIRARLDRDVTSLEARLAPPAVLAAEARKVGAVAAAGVAALTTLLVVLGRRRSDRARERDLRAQAAEIARVLPDVLAGSTGGARGEATSHAAAGQDSDSNPAEGSSRRGGWLLTLLAAAGAVAGYVVVSRRAR